MKIAALTFSISALLLGGCSNLQTEYEKQSQTIQEQKVIIAELTQSNSYLKAENMRLEAELKKAQLRADHQNRVGSLSSTYEQKLQQMINNLNSQLDSSLSSVPDVSVTKSSEGTVITMSNSILFRPGSASLLSSGKKVLAKVVNVIKDYPNKTIRVDGHTDSDPIRKTKSKFSSNWDLSAKRAVGVVEELTSHSSISGERVFVSAYSKYRPVDANNKKLNRRVEIVVLDR
jgi:chemotaxis protein MotB